MGVRGALREAERQEGESGAGSAVRGRRETEKARRALPAGGARGGRRAGRAPGTGLARLRPCKSGWSPAASPEAPPAGHAGVSGRNHTDGASCGGLELSHAQV